MMPTPDAVQPWLVLGVAAVASLTRLLRAIVTADSPVTRALAARLRRRSR